MKKLLLLLLFIPLVSFGQSQIINGIELNGRQGMVKAGDLTWEDNDSSLSVVSIGKMFLTKKQKEEMRIKSKIQFLERMMQFLLQLLHNKSYHNSYYQILLVC